MTVRDSGSCTYERRLVSKYPPAEPGALVREPPKAAYVLRVPLFRAVGHLKVASLGYSKRS